MDQLASIGVAFDDEAIETIFEKTVQYYESLREPSPSIGSLFSRKPKQQWATQSVYDKHHPVRPWGLGKIYNSDTGIWNLAGKQTRTPGLYTRPDPNTGMPTRIPMTHTNERIHSSVRIRLELGGLGEDDLTTYKCPALLKKGPWRLDQIRIKVTDPIPPTATWGPSAPAALDHEISDMRWVWEYDGPEHNAPVVQTMIEENLGPYERKLLLLNKGTGMFHKVIDDADEEERRASYEKYTTRKRRKKKRRKRYEKGHMGDDLLEEIGGETAVNGEFDMRREEVVSYGSAPFAVDADDEEIDEKLARKHRDYSRNRRSRREIEEEEEAIKAKLARMEMGNSYTSRGRDAEEEIEEKTARMEMGPSAPRRRSHRDSGRGRDRGKERDSYSYSSKRRSEMTEDPYIITGVKERVGFSSDVYGHTSEMAENYSEKRVPINRYNDEIGVVDDHSEDGHSQAHTGEDNKRRSVFGSVRGGGGSDREYGDGHRVSGDPYSYKEHRTHSPNPSRRGESRRDRRTWAERGARSSSSRQS
ncbi:Peptidoglycan binding domain-containing protein [Rutstroemia sp. NJR-2017a WRK4]|nr:Peptidoglycan binding domain-containing protein [Rutstroemia sp. NJR-2017a WRK4]